MESKWQFDKEYLKSIIERGYLLLQNPNLSQSKRKVIISDIKTFQQFLTGNFDNATTNRTVSYDDIETIKRYILYKMKKQYSTFGKELIDWIISLDEENIFEAGYSFDETKLSIDEQAELTLKNYEKNSKFLLEYAKQILLPNPTSQIQLVEGLDSSSYCHYSDIDKRPFIIVDSTESSWIFNHEIQHSIEDTLRLYPHKTYLELGAILFELLFLDTLFKKQNFLYDGDYKTRIENTSDQLSSLSAYFKVMQTFAKNDFKVSTDVFQTIFLDNVDIIEENLLSYLKEDILGDELESDMSYLFSYLKAIELREIIKSTDDDCIDILYPYLSYPKFNFKPQKETFKLYEKFIEEMKQKTRKLKRY